MTTILKNTDHDRSYLNNIKPLLNKETLTKHLDKHPIWEIKNQEKLVKRFSRTPIVAPLDIELQNLDCVITGEQREIIFHSAEKGHYDKKQIRRYINKIINHEQMKLYKPFYKERSTKLNNNFGRFYDIAKKAGVDELLTKWLNHNDQD